MFLLEKYHAIGGKCVYCGPSVISHVVFFMVQCYNHPMTQYSVFDRSVVTRKWLLASLFAVVVLFSAVAYCWFLGRIPFASNAGRLISSVERRFLRLPRLANTRKHENQVQKMVSLAPNLTKVILDLGQGDRLVAVSAGAHHPVEVSGLPRIDFSSATEGLRMVEKLDAQIVLGLPLKQDESGERSDKHGRGVIFYDVSNDNLYSFEDVFSLIARVGFATHQTQRAYELVDRARTQLNKIGLATLHQTESSVAFLYPLCTSGEACTSFVVAAAATPEQDALFYVHGKNAFSHLRGYPQVSAKDLALARPDLLVVHPSQLALVSAIPACKPFLARGKVIALDSGDLMSSRLADATRRLAESVHPSIGMP